MSGEYADQGKAVHYSFEKSLNQLEVPSMDTECQVSPIWSHEGKPSNKSTSYRPLALNAPNTAGHAIQQQPGSCGSHKAKVREQENVNCQSQESATPYTRSDTEPSKGAFDSTAEAHLLKILHTGLHSSGDTEKRSARKVKRYLNLEELRAMLESRKMNWTIDIEHPRLKSTEPSGPDCRLASVPNSPGTSGEFVRKSSPCPVYFDNVLSDGAALPHCRDHLDDQLSAAANLDYLKAPFPPQPPKSPGVNNGGHIASIDDDDAFFRTLDATYNDIVKSDGQGLGSACDQLELQDAEIQHSVVAKEQLLAPNAMYISHQGLCHPPGRNETQNRRRLSSLAHQQRPSRERLPLMDQRRQLAPANSHDAPWMERITEQRHKSLSSDHPRESPSLSIPSIDTSYTVPPGFWRQNKLY